MTKPVTIPNTFATATTAIPLSQLDGDFTAVATAINDANTYSNYAADTGSANAYVVTFSGVSTTYSAGLRIQFKAGNANTGASTINVNAQGAKSITYQDGNALASGAIAVNSIVDVMYDGTQFLLMNDPAGATGGDVTGPASATDNAVVRFDGTTGKLVQNSVVTIADSTGDISGVGQLNATTVDTTNLEVTNIKAIDGTAAASIANSTGVVSITANPVLSGGTANGVLYLNGSKVATSGSALVFDGTNLGLGIASVSAAGTTMHINGTSDASIRFTNSASGTGVNNGFKLQANGIDAYLVNYSSGGMIFYTNNAEQMRLTSTGLGIGTSSITDRLTVVAATGTTFLGSSTNTNQAYHKVNNAAGNVYFGVNNSANTFFAASAYAGIVWHDGNYPLVFGTNNTERARITSGGDLLVGITTPQSGIASDPVGISLYGSSAPGVGVFTRNQSGGSVLYVNNKAATGQLIQFYCNGNLVGDIASNGTTTSYNTSSDYRLKENIAPMTGALDKVAALKPCTYTWKADGSAGEGFIAHELAEVVPQCVTGEKNAVDADGNPKYQGIDTSFLVATLTAAIQEQQALIESLTSRVSQLEGTQP